MPPAMTSVYSSHAHSIGYDAEAQELHVRWKGGKTSIYSGVPIHVAHDVTTNWSVGNAVHTMVKGTYAHRYAD